MTPATAPGSFPDYAPGLFVERREIKEVCDVVQSVVAGRPDAPRAICVTGERGVGKTWLLHHLADGAVTHDGRVLDIGDELRGGGAICAPYLDLEEAWPGVPERWEEIAKSLIVALDRHVADRAGITPTTTVGGGTAARLDDLSRWLEADVREFTSQPQRTFVLLADHVFESDWRLLDRLDRHLLGPLAAIPRVLVILAGRGRPYPWLSPYLRLPDRSREIHLAPFDALAAAMSPPMASQTLEQLRKQVNFEITERRAFEIWQESGGYPRTNYAIAKLGAKPGLEEEICSLLNSVLDVKLRDALRVALESVCVLETFRDEAILYMITGHPRSFACAVRTFGEVTKIRGELVKYAFVNWDNRSGEWKLDDQLQTLLRRWLETYENDTWLRLQYAAYYLFEKWIREYPGAGAPWKAEAQRHRTQIEKSGAKLPDCLNGDQMAKGQPR